MYILATDELFVRPTEPEPKHSILIKTARQVFGIWWTDQVPPTGNKRAYDLEQRPSHL